MRNSLQEQALGLFLQQGVEGVTIDEIVLAASVAKGSFYRYFSDKTDLVENLIEPVRFAVRECLQLAESELDAARTKDELLGAYQALSMRMAIVIIQHADVVRLYLQEARAPSVGARRALCELSKEFAHASLRLTLAAESHGLLRRVDARVTSLAVLGAVERLMFEALCTGTRLDAEATGNALVTMVLEGLRA